MTLPLGRSTENLSEERGDFGDEVRRKECTENGFPICIREAILDMFGTSGALKLMAIADRGDFAKDLVSVPMSATDFYEQHMNSWRKLLGEEVTEIIETKAMRKVEFLQCQNCVLSRMRKISQGSRLECTRDR